jgi:hypothetical protein
MPARTTTRQSWNPQCLLVDRVTPIIAGAPYR